MPGLQPAFHTATFESQKANIGLPIPSVPLINSNGWNGAEIGTSAFGMIGLESQPFHTAIVAPIALGPSGRSDTCKTTLTPELAVSSHWAVRRSSSYTPHLDAGRYEKLWSPDGSASLYGI